MPTRPRQLTAGPSIVTSARMTSATWTSRTQFGPVATGPFCRMTDGRPLTVGEVAAHLGVARSTVFATSAAVGCPQLGLGARAPTRFGEALLAAALPEGQTWDQPTRQTTASGRSRALIHRTLNRPWGKGVARVIRADQSTAGLVRANELPHDRIEQGAREGVRNSPARDYPTTRAFGVACCSWQAPDRSPRPARATSHEA